VEELFYFPISLPTKTLSRRPRSEAKRLEISLLLSVEVRDMTIR